MVSKQRTQLSQGCFWGCGPHCPRRVGAGLTPAQRLKTNCCTPDAPWRTHARASTCRPPDLTPSPIETSIVSPVPQVQWATCNLVQMDLNYPQMRSLKDYPRRTRSASTETTGPTDLFTCQRASRGEPPHAESVHSSLPHCCAKSVSPAQPIPSSVRNRSKNSRHDAQKCCAGAVPTAPAKPRGRSGANRTHFHRQFSARFGASPASYRKQRQKDPGRDLLR